MRVLGIDTSTGHLGLALWFDDRLLGELELDLGRKHCETMGAALDGLLTDLGLGIGDLGGIAVAQGPGSFTGLRIGVAFAQGLALASGRPLVGVSTLDALAHGAGLWEGRLVACLDARRGEVYFGAYLRERGGARRIGDSQVGPVGQAAELCASFDTPVLVVGDAAETIRAAAEETRVSGPAITAAPPEYGLPRAAVVAALGGERLARGGDHAPEHVQPIYLRRSDAEIRRDVMAGRT